MFLEMFIFSLCVYGQDGCSEAKSAYLRHNNALSQNLKRAGKYATKHGNDVLGKEGFFLATTGLILITQEKYGVKLHKGTFIEYNHEQGSWAAKFSYSF